MDQALATLKAHEGGFSDDPDDPGGATNFGVSLRFLRTLGHDLADVDGDGDVDVDDVKNLTWQQACDRVWVPIFWKATRFCQLPDALAVKTFDLGVNMGPVQAGKLLQRALRACLEPVGEDGIVGRATLDAIGRVDAPGAVLASLRSEAAGFYRALVAKNPSMAKFLDGWLSRAYS